MYQLVSTQSSGVNFNGKTKLVRSNNATFAQRKQFKSLVKKLKRNKDLQLSKINTKNTKDKFVASKNVSDVSAKTAKDSVVTTSVNKDEEPSYNPFMDTYYNPLSERLMNFENPVSWFIGLFFK